MTFHWPWLLTAAVVIPVAIGAYVRSERRKRKYAVQFASLSLIREALPRSSRWRRHLPFALLLVAIASLVVAMGRPQTTVPVPRSQTSIILTLDVSRSMCSTDVKPNRLAAAEKAADSLIRQQVGGTRIGIVAFSGAAQILVSPTTDTKKLTTAVHDLTTGGGTAIGNGILAAIDAISRVNRSVAPSTVNVNAPDGQSAGSGKQYQPDIIVVLTDGANNRGVDPQVAAAQAAGRKVRVYTIGFGTDDPGALVGTRDQLGPDPYGGGGRFGGGGFGGGFGGGGGPGGGNPSRFVNEDQQALEAISSATGGTAFRAASAQQLLDVFRKLPSRVVVQHQEREVSVIFVGTGALLALLALGVSMRWNRSP